MSHWCVLSGGRSLEGFYFVVSFTPEESSPPSASAVTPSAADAGHVQHPQRRKSPRAAALQCHAGLSPRALTWGRGPISVFNAVGSFWG